MDELNVTPVRVDESEHSAPKEARIFTAAADDCDGWVRRDESLVEKFLNHLRVALSAPHV